MCYDLLSSAVPEAFELSTERRARERQELERLACEREAELAMLKEEERRREEQQEKEEIARMRQDQASGLRSTMRAFPPCGDQRKLDVPAVTDLFFFFWSISCRFTKLNLSDTTKLWR